MKFVKLLKYILYVAAFLLLVFSGMYLSSCSDAKPLSVDSVDYVTEEEVVVEIKGEVKSPGKYSVPVGTPLHDVIYMADGLTKYGDPKSVNLSGFITKSCTINVEKKKNDDEAILDTPTFDSEKKCDINKASVSELASLPGIGEALAHDIVNYRKVNGDFKTSEDIKKVKGIGDKKYDKLKDLIEVGG